jgi:hypothetical protein
MSSHETEAAQSECGNEPTSAAKPNLQWDYESYPDHRPACPPYTGAAQVWCLIRPVTLRPAGAGEFSSRPVATHELPSGSARSV